jgi:hypothetical protein
MQELPTIQSSLKTKEEVFGAQHDYDENNIDIFRMKIEK